MGWVQEGVAPSILGEVQFGVQGQNPSGCLGTKSPEAEGFFHFQRVIVALNWGEAVTISGRF